VLTVVKLKVGDLVANDSGDIGKVLHFTRDRVAIDWGSSAKAYTDDDLRARGVVLVEGQR
jgi:hypothetical protein